eukprot:3390827-Pyramimonas_sp.AAC.1
MICAFSPFRFRWPSKAQDGSKRAQYSPKRGPRGPQDGPKNAPRAPQEGSRRLFWRLPRGGANWGAPLL